MFKLNKKLSDLDNIDLNRINIDKDDLDKNNNYDYYYPMWNLK